MIKSKIISSKKAAVGITLDTLIGLFLIVLAVIAIIALYFLISQSASANLKSIFKIF